jgi:hypothetical protein
MGYKPGRVVVTAIALSMAMVHVPLGPVYASIVETEDVLAGEHATAERERVTSFFAREQVRDEFRKFGVNPDEAAARVAAMSDQEIIAMGARIDQLPAGQDGFGAVLGVALTIFIILLITDILCLTSVFNFTRCARR